MALTYVKSSGIDVTGNYTANAMTLTTNLIAGNVKTANLVDVSGTTTLVTKHNSRSGDVGILGNLVVGFSGAGNCTASYFVGNGSQLTGLPASYSDSNVATYLPNYSGTLNLTNSSNVTLGAVGNIHITGGTTGQVLSTDGAGNLSWADGGTGGGGTYVTRKYVADGTSNSYTVTSGCAVDDVLVFINGVCQAPTDDYTISGTSLTVDGTPASGTKIQIRELPK